MKALVLAENSDFTLNLLRCLSKARVKNHVMGVGKMPMVALSRHCQKYTSCDPGEFENPSESIINKIKDYCVREEIDVVMAANMHSSFLLSQIKNEIAQTGSCVFPIADSDHLQTLHNKWSFRNLLKEHDIPIPETRLLETLAQIDSLEMDFPLVVKPVDRGNKLGVKVLSSKEELSAHISEGKEGSQFPLILQEYIPGTDVDLNILAKKGKVQTWSIQKWASADTLEFIEDPLILDIGKKIVEVSNYTGVAHFDMRMDSRDGSIKVIECNPRFWGSMRASMWNGVNFVEMGILASQGKAISEHPENKQITYRLPSQILTEILRGKLQVIFKIPKYSLFDVWQILSDPFSFAYQISTKLTKKRAVQ